MSLWEAIVLTLAGSACMNLGLVLQKKGIGVADPPPPGSNASFGPGGPAALAESEPRARRRGRVRPQRIWYVGMALLIGGYAVYAVAVGAKVAPISLLQPLSASGLLVVAFLAVVYLHEQFHALEWLGVGFLLGGVILLGFSADDSGRFSPVLHGSRVIVFLAATGALALFVSVAIRRTTGPGRAPGRAEFLFGILAGLFLGTGYLNTRTVVVAFREQKLAILLVAIASMAGGLIVGLALLQMGYRRGRALIVTAVNLVTNQVLVVSGGLICLGESFPREPVPFAARVAGLAGILGGIVLLARLSAGSNGRTPAANPLQPVEAESN